MRVAEIREWRGDMEADYLYTVGLAGERFFREIRDSARLMGTYCPQCDLLYLPPRVYCEDCFEPLDEWEEVSNKGRIAAYSVAHRGPDGRPLERAETWVLVKFPGVRGGLIHRLNLPPEAASIGGEVEAVFEEHRTGSLADIRYFKAI